jgi:hypothetical protein
MNQRGVTLIATYLSKRPLGRIVQVRPVGDDDYIVAVDDRRDGRTQLIHSSGDLRLWFESFRHGECLIPAAGICARCNKLHVDRDVDGELLGHCITCAGELIGVGAEMFLQKQERG